MRRLFMMVCVLAAVALQSAFAGEVREIEMGDGSVLTGEVVSLANGVYTIQSPSLGTIKVAESSVRAIRTPGSAGQRTASAQDNADAMRAVQSKMMNDPEIMAKIQSLQNDPEFQKILADPGIMKAVQAGDVAALSANPRFMQLLNNATVQDIRKKVE